MNFKIILTEKKSRPPRKVYYQKFLSPEFHNDIYAHVLSRELKLLYKHFQFILEKSNFYLVIVQS